MGLTTIHETEESKAAVRHAEEEGRGGKGKAWVFQGKVQGSIVFRQYYPEGGWGCVILLTGLVMTILTTGFQMTFSVLVKPAVWKFQPSMLSFLSLTGLSCSVSMILSPLTVSFCKVYKYIPPALPSQAGGLFPVLLFMSLSFRKSPSD